jgi:excisionase family DNA binding protein
MNGKQFMTRMEVAEYLGVHPLTVYKEIRNGRLPATKVASVYRINTKDVEKYIKDNQAEISD